MGEQVDQRVVGHRVVFGVEIDEVTRAIWTDHVVVQRADSSMCRRATAGRSG
jgi:hypothetical protein